MKNKRNFLKNPYFWLSLSCVYLFLVIFFAFVRFPSEDGWYYKVSEAAKELITPKYPRLDEEDYDSRVYNLANMVEIAASSSASTTPTNISTSTLKTYQTSWGKKNMLSPLWPVQTVYPADGAILPFKRIVAYYGNFYSTGMGILGQYPEEQVLEKLKGEVEKWNLADPNTPALPSIHYIAVTAQEFRGEDGKYRARMPADQLNKAIAMAKKAEAIVFFDIQVGLSTIQEELPLFAEYLKLPEVNIAIDPEFSMKSGDRPGTVVGTYDAADINFVIDYMANIVKENDLPPKILVVHRYRPRMMTNYQNIKTVPEVQVVIDMDGWGPRDNKLSTYYWYIYLEPVQFTGFKLFYKNDVWQKGTTLMTPEEILKLTPRPIYIQYQ